MPNAVQTIAGFSTAAGAGTNVLTPAAGDTFVVPSFDLSSKAYLENIWGSGATHTAYRIRSPRLHDANQGLRVRSGSAQRRLLLPWANQEVLYPSDAPVVEVVQTGAGTDGMCANYGFDDLPGVAPRLAAWSEVESRIQHIMGCEVTAVSGAIGQWGAGVALNSSFDNFEAGQDYALLGFTLSTAVLAVAVSGKDTGNLKIGGPGSDDAIQTRDFFIDQSLQLGKPRIPIIAANNRGSTLVQVVDVAAATSSTLTLLLAELA